MTFDPASLIGRVMERAAAKAGGAPPPASATTEGAQGDDVLVDQLASQLVSYLGLTPENHTDERTHVAALIERSGTLSRALGACECWGELPTCGACRGRGSPGWTLPNRRLFESFVRPALRTIRQHQTALHNSGGSRLHI